MPKYTYICSKCGRSRQKYAVISCKKIDCECGDSMNRAMPKLSAVKTTETVDKFTNKKHMQDHNEILRERKADHYWEVLVPEMVNSGTYQLDTMLEQGWVFYNEKGVLETRTKPPQKS